MCKKKCKTEFVLTLKQRDASTLPRKLVAFAVDGQVGVESTGDCGPVRAEAGDWHKAHTARGLPADNLTATLTLLGSEEGREDAACRESTHTLFFCCT